MSEAVGVGACFDDGPVEGEPVDDRCAEAGVGEGFRPPREGLVTGDRDGVLLFAFGEDLEEEFGAAPVEFGLSEQLGWDPVWPMTRETKATGQSDSFDGLTLIHGRPVNEPAKNPAIAFAEMEEPVASVIDFSLRAAP